MSLFHPSKLAPDIEAYLSKLQESFDEISLSTAREPAAETYSDPNDVDGENPSPLTLLARNALCEVSKNISEVARDNHACRLLEQLLPHAGVSACMNVLDAVLESGSRQFASLAMHPQASHLLDKCLKAAINLSVSPSEKLGLAVTEWTREMICDVILSPAGTYVFRAIVTLLARVSYIDEPSKFRLSDDKPPSYRYFDNEQKDENKDNNSINDNDKNAISHLANTLMSTEDKKGDTLQHLSCVPTSCAALQALMTSLTICNPPLAQQFASTLVPTDQENVLEMTQARCASRLVDRIILTCGPDRLPSALESLLRDDQAFLNCVQHGSANFCIQRYISSLNNRADVVRVVRILEEPIQTTLLTSNVRREGVVLALVRVVETMADRKTQALIARAIARGVDAVDKDARHIVGHLLVRGKVIWMEWCRKIDSESLRGSVNQHTSSNHDNKDKNNSNNIIRLPRGLPRCSVTGALIIRSLMRMPEGPGQSVRASMSGLSNKQLLALCADGIGSRVIEQWIQDVHDINRSEKIAGKIITVLLGDLKHRSDQYVISVCRHASAGMVLVKCIERASVPVRRKTMAALAQVYQQMVDDRFGSVVMRKCRVRQYMNRSEDWDKMESGRETRQRLFADILGGDEEEEEQKLHGNGNSRTEKTMKKRKRNSDIHKELNEKGVTDSKPKKKKNKKNRAKDR